MIAARDYLRVSKDPRGVSASKEQQHAENVETWTDFEFGASYDDTESASSFQRRDRAGFDRLVADLECDVFGAQLLVLWESSRGSRKVGEWTDLLDLLVLRGVKVAVTIDHRIYDASDPHDRKQLLHDAVDSEYASALTSLRVRRDVKRAAKDGRPHGKVPFGYRRRYDPITRKADQEPDPVEAPLVRELFDRLAKGHSLKAIERDWAERGIESRGSPNVPARPFKAASLRWMATSSAYAGLRSHRPGGRRSPKAATVVVPGTWEALVSPDVFHKVRRLLADPARKTTRPGRGVHLLSRIARCGHDGCDGVLAVGYGGFHRERQYICEFGHVRANADELDAFAEEAIIGYLSDPGEWEATFGVDDYDERAAPILDEIAEVQARLDDLYGRVRRGDLSGEALAAIEPGLLADRAGAQKRLASLSTPVGLGDLITPGADVVARWVTMPMAARREVVRMLLGEHGVLGTLRLGHARPGGGRGGPAPWPVAQRARIDR